MAARDAARQSRRARRRACGLRLRAHRRGTADAGRRARGRRRRRGIAGAAITRCLDAGEARCRRASASRRRAQRASPAPGPRLPVGEDAARARRWMGRRRSGRAMIEGSSPGTSETRRASNRAGYAAAASWPPLIRLRCLRTTFISPIVAPESSRASLTACFSARVMPSGGREERRAAAGDEAEHEVVLAQPLDQLEDAPRRVAARRVGDRVGGLDHLQPLGRRAVAVAGDDQAFERPVPGLLERRAMAPRPCRRR